VSHPSSAGTWFLFETSVYFLHRLTYTQFPQTGWAKQVIDYKIAVPRCQLFTQWLHR